jgi:hypothetical protein
MKTSKVGTSDHNTNKCSSLNNETAIKKKQKIGRECSTHEEEFSAYKMMVGKVVKNYNLSTQHVGRDFISYRNIENYKSYW